MCSGLPRNMTGGGSAPRRWQQEQEKRSGCRRCGWSWDQDETVWISGFGVCVSEMDTSVHGGQSHTPATSGGSRAGLAAFLALASCSGENGRSSRPLRRRPPAIASCSSATVSPISTIFPGRSRGSPARLTQTIAVELGREAELCADRPRGREEQRGRDDRRRRLGLRGAAAGSLGSRSLARHSAHRHPAARSRTSGPPAAAAPC